MATTTIGELLLHMEVDGERSVISALQRVVRETNNANKATNNYGNTANRSRGHLTGFNITLSTMVKGFAALKVIDVAADALSYFGDKIKEGINTGIKYNTRIELLTASMKALTGSEEVAIKLTRDLTILAAETPFSIEHYAKAAKTLLGYGVEADKVLSVSEMLGNVAMGNTSAFDKLSLAYGQVMAKGKLQAEEVRQMVNQGFNPLKFIAEETGIKFEDLADKMRKGEISSEMVTLAFMKATEKGGRFHNSMEILSKTYAGQSEKIKEYGEIFWGNVTRPLQSFIAAKIFPTILQGIKKLTNGVDIVYGVLGNAIPKVIDFFDAFVKGDIEGIYNALKKLIPDEFKSKLADISIVSLKFRRILGYLYDKFKDLYNFLKLNMIKAWEMLGDGIEKKAYPIIKNIIDLLKSEDFAETRKSLSDLLQMFVDSAPLLIKFGKIFVELIVNQITHNLKSLKTIVENIDKVLSIFIDTLTIVGDGIQIFLAVLIGDFDKAFDLIGKQLETGVRLFFNFGTTTDKIFKDLGTNILKTYYNMIKDSDTLWGNLIVGAVTKTIELKETIKTKYDELKTSVYNILLSMIATMINKFNEIKNSVSSTITNIKTDVINKFNEIKNSVSSTITNIKTTIVNKFNEIKNKVVNKFNEIKTNVETIIDVIKFIIYSKFIEISKIIMPPLTMIWNVVKAAFDLVATIIKEVLWTVKTIVTEVFLTIKLIIAEVLNIIVPIVTNAFNSIKSFIFTTTAMIYMRIRDKFNQIKAIIMTVLTPVVGFIIDKFNYIKNFIFTTTAMIYMRIRDKFNQIKAIIMSVLTPVVGFIIDKFNYIKSFIFTTTAMIYMKIRDKFNQIKAVIMSVLTPVVGFISDKFNFIKNFIFNVMNLIFNKIRDKFTSSKNTITSTTESTKNNVTNKFKAIYNIIKSVLGLLKSKITYFFSNYRTVIRNAGNNIRKSIHNSFTTMKNSVNTILNTIKSIIKKAMNINLYQAGKNLMNTLLNGINSKIRAIKNAVANVSQTIKNFIGWESPTKEGAGRTAHKWMPNLMNMLIADLDKFKSKFGASTGRIASTIRDNLNFTPSLNGTIPNVSRYPLGGTTASSNNNTINITINTNSNTSGQQIGQILVKELNQLGILTHK